MEIRRERKVITVLFVDLVGFTSMSEAMDPEDVEVALSRYHSDVRTELERFGGTVEKFIGDAVMAIFGAPVAHEDDAERAVRAALAVRDWATSGSGLEVRIGVNTGETLVRLGASAESGEGLAVGDVVNTTARLQTAAPTNGVIVGEATYRATRSVIDYEPTEPITAKGKAERVPAWIALDARSRFGVDLGEAPQTKFVGRENELGLLRSSLSRARAEHQPQLVTLVGVPGIGKSRLLHELWRLVEADPELITWRQGRCLPYGDGVSMWALTEIVKAEAGIFEGDGPEVAEQKLIKAVETQEAASDPEWMIERLRPLIGVGQATDSQGVRGEQFTAWRQFLENLADDGPAVVIFEDLHWADETLLDFVDELNEDASGVPLFIVCTARPELLAKRPAWGAGRTNALTLSLQPLPAERTADLVEDVLAATDASPELRQKILDQAEGNPLYAEEYARMVAENATSDLGLPDSIQGIIAARLDTLELPHKRILQLAAVIGKVFWATAVARILGAELREVEEGLQALERRELVRKERRSSLSGVTQYAFRHITTRDVAYGQIPRGDRSLLHQGVAEWLASLGRPEDHAELIAHHYLEAIEYARAAARDVSEFSEVARKALRDAGERAAALANHAPAAQFLGKALELAPDGPEHAELLAASGMAQYLATGDISTEFQEAVAALEALGQHQAAAACAARLARAYNVHGNFDAAATWLDTADRLAAGLHGSVVHADVMISRAGMEMTASRFQDALDLLVPFLPDVERLESPALHARTLDIIGLSRCMLGDESGMDDQWRAVEIARNNRAVRELQLALNNLGVSINHLGRLRELRPLSELRQETFDSFGGSAETRSWFTYSMAFVGYHDGDWDAALRAIAMVLDQIPSGSTMTIESNVLELRTRVMVTRDLGYDPRPELQRMLMITGTRPDPSNWIAGPLVAADVLATARADEEARAMWREGMTQFAAHGAPDLDRELVDLAWTAVQLNVEDHARTVVARYDGVWATAASAILAHEFGQAAEMLDQIGHVPAAALANMHVGGPNLQKALEFWQSVGATRYINAIEAGEYN